MSNVAGMGGRNVKCPYLVLTNCSLEKRKTGINARSGGTVGYEATISAGGMNVRRQPKLVGLTYAIVN